MTGWILLFLLAWAIWAVKTMKKRRKAGKSLTCGGDCSHCMSACGKKAR